jgi:hypothetical protein
LPLASRLSSPVSFYFLQETKTRKHCRRVSIC